MIRFHRVVALYLLLATFLISVKSFAITQVRVSTGDPNIAPAILLNSLEASRCENCGPSQSDNRPNPLLQNIYMYGIGRNGKVWDYRQQHRPSTLGPLRAVGRLLTERFDKNRSRYGASAFLVSPCHIITSAHAASDVKNGTNWRSIQFRIGDDELPVQARRIQNAVVKIGGAGSCNEDLEVLRLDKCVGDQYGYLPIRPVPISEFAEMDVVSASFPGSSNPANGITIDPNCEMNDSRTLHFPNNATAVYALTSCTIDGGSSGGPIVTRSDFPEVIGISCATLGSQTASELPFQQRYEDVSKGVGNVVTPIAPNYERIMRILSSSSETDFIMRNSGLPVPNYQGATSPAGPWQHPGSGVPSMPVLTRTGRPLGWGAMINPNDRYTPGQ